MKILCKKNIYIHSSRGANIQSDTSYPFEPNSHTRILILAPHPDDETLAAGGVIATAMKLGNQVRVIVVTNGDASYATALTYGSHFITRKNFERLASIRQHESMNALAMLGLAPEQVVFWGFPDRGLAALWNSLWDDKHPYHSITTGHNSSQEALNCPILSYTGTNLDGLIVNELLGFYPTTVIMPHPYDHHSDHRALADFVLRAVKQYHLQSQRPMPVLLSYWMWHQHKPWMTATYSKDIDSPPVQANLAPEIYQCLTLDSEISAKKTRALQCYPSQKIPAGIIFWDVTKSPYEIFTLLKPSF